MPNLLEEYKDYALEHGNAELEQTVENGAYSVLGIKPKISKGADIVLEDGNRPVFKLIVVPRNHELTHLEWSLEPGQTNSIIVADNTFYKSQPGMTDLDDDGLTLGFSGYFEHTPLDKPGLVTLHTTYGNNGLHTVSLALLGPDGKPLSGTRSIIATSDGKSVTATLLKESSEGEDIDYKKAQKNSISVAVQRQITPEGVFQDLKDEIARFFSEYRQFKRLKDGKSFVNSTGSTASN